VAQTGTSGSIFYQNPIVGVSAIIIKDMRVLLGKRKGSYEGLISKNSLKKTLQIQRKVQKYCLPSYYAKGGACPIVSDVVGAGLMQ